MNERMIELALQAGYNIKELDVQEQMVAKKFAELIVRECSKIAKQTDADDGDDYKSGRQWAGIDILKHFNVGVE